MLELPGHTELVVSARGAADIGERCNALIDRIADALTTVEPSTSRPETKQAGEPVAAERLLTPGPDGLPPLDTTVVQLFRAQTARSPQAPAVTGDTAHWPYDELERRSDAVAAELLARGVQRGETVGVLADRTAYGIAGVWGVLKAGAAFLPIDVRNPAQRVAELLHDAQARFCLAETAWPDSLRAPTARRSSSRTPPALSAHSTSQRGKHWSPLRRARTTWHTSSTPPVPPVGPRACRWSTGAWSTPSAGWPRSCGATPPRVSRIPSRQALTCR